MKHPLLIAGHPNLANSSFSAGVLSGVASLKKPKIVVHRLADQPWNMPFDPQQELSRITAASRIIVLFPIH